jgi:hypothetical protein
VTRPEGRLDCGLESEPYSYAPVGRSAPRKEYDGSSYGVFGPAKGRLRELVGGEEWCWW